MTHTHTTLQIKTKIFVEDTPLFRLVFFLFYFSGGKLVCSICNGNDTSNAKLNPNRNRQIMGWEEETKILIQFRK